MTDTRLRGEWLNTMRFDNLSDAAWRVFCYALMWCNQNGTDGLIPTRYLRMTHPDGSQDRAYLELEAAGLWEPVSVGFQFTNWDGELGQSTAAYVRTQRENNAARQRSKREKDRLKMEKQTDAVTRDDHRDDHPHVGRGKGQGQAQDEGVTPELEETREWPVVAIGRGAA